MKIFYTFDISENSAPCFLLIHKKAKTLTMIQNSFLKKYHQFLIKNLDHKGRKGKIKSDEIREGGKL